MNFDSLQMAINERDEIRIIGRDVERDGRLCHIVGMTRQQDQAKLYVLEDAMPQKREVEMPDHPRPAKESADPMTETPDHPLTEGRNRDSLRHADDRNYFDWVKAIRIGELELPVESACAACFGIADNFENWLLMYEMMKAGWSLPEHHPFRERDWECLLLKEIVFDARLAKLPDWDGNEIRIRRGERHQQHLLELPVWLAVGEKQEIAFALADGRTGTCYISDVYPIDVWAEHERQFEDPRYREILSEEQLAEHKAQVFAGLEQDCPRGMCFLGVEYECTLGGSLTFYDRAFLDAGPAVHSGSVTIRMIVLKPDDPAGEHGYRKQGCAIQTPLPPDVRTLDAELFFYTEHEPETEERLDASE